MNGPDHTVVAQGVTGLGDRWQILRRRGGRMVRITLPLTLDTDAAAAELAALALARLPDKPGSSVY